MKRILIPLAGAALIAIAVGGAQAQSKKTLAVVVKTS